MAATNSTAWRRFGLAFLAAFLFCGSGTLVLGRLPAAARCRPSASPDTFMGECRGIGDYEHAAYAFALEPRAVAALGAAQVVMLGNSRAQFAFSSEAARRWFSERGVAAYRIGFGYDEGAPFALTVMGRAGTRARLAIVNADTFFTDRRSLPASRIRDEPWRSWVAALRTRAALDLRAAICANVPLALACKGKRSAIHRVRGDGAWAWRDSLTPAGGATAIDAAPGEEIVFPPETADRARAFLAGTGVNPRCLVLTSVPNSLVEARAATAALARDLGASAILPRIGGLRTIDGSHLEAESAEAWSAVFLAELDPILHACLPA